MFFKTEKYRDLGLLILRVGIGLMFAYHGAPKLFGGPEKWEKLGGAMGNFGLDIFPVFWGFMASVSEFVGGIFLAVGFLTGPSCALLAVTMIIAAVFHLAGGDGLGRASHAIEAGILFISLIFIGAGKYSLDFRLRRGSRPE
ncbi:MAG: DoxX family protein [candidate division Zixibacteria bacterium]